MCVVERMTVGRMRSFAGGLSRCRRRHIRVAMLSTPGNKILVLGQDGINELIDHVIGWLAEELRVRVQRLVVLAIETRNVPYKLLAARTRFDHRHEMLLTSRIAIGCSQTLAAYSAITGGTQSSGYDRRYVEYL